MSVSVLEATAALAPDVDPRSTTRPGASANGSHRSRLLVDRWLTDRGVQFRTKPQPGGTAYIITCPFDPSHGSNGETAIYQRDDGMLSFECKHSSCQGRKWVDARDKLGKPDPIRHYDPPLQPTSKPTGKPLPTLAPGTIVKAGDRGNYGEVVADHGETCTVHFRSPDGQQATKKLPKSQLRLQDGSPVDPSASVDIGSPVPLRSIVQAYPRLRPPVIDKLVRRGETVNIVADPKRGKSWLAVGMGLAVADGFPWLDTFECEQGRVLLIDAELHKETIAHRLPMAAEATGASADYADRIDVWSVRGKGVDLCNIGSAILALPRDRYSLVIADAWYRFLPPGISENDNAAVMSLYNLIDSYTAHLNAAWVNIHHTSKGDQSQKGITDVGSGAGSQSRAADTHLIIRPHEEDDVAVLEGVVRSFPPIERLAIRFDFPAWFLDREADPNAVRNPRDRSSKADKDRHLEGDRKAIVEVMAGLAKPETKSFIREAARVGNPRFGYAWASLLLDKTVVQCDELVKRGNNQSYEAFRLSQ